MVISSFYNSETKALMICANNKEIDYTKENQKDDILEVKIFDSNHNLIGVNLLNYDLQQKSGIVNNLEIMDILKEYFFGEIDFPYVVGYVKSIKKHPKSDKLNICQVDFGKEEVQIVCGASNVCEGIKVIVSQVGAIMPNGMAIKPSKLIDEVSNGMITSLFELGLNTDKTQGIAILSDDEELGKPYYG